MSNELLSTSAWSTPHSHGDRPATTVAVLGEDPTLAHQVAAAIDPAHRVHAETWHHGDVPVDPAHLAGELRATGATVVCIGADVPLRVALDVAAVVDRDHADMTVVLVASLDEDWWREALRAGVRDVVEPWRVDLELEPALGRALERTARVREQWPAPAVSDTPVTGRVIVVISPKGGSGKTMVASNLAVALAKADGGAVALVDLDVQFGDSATALGLAPERSIGDLATATAIDSTTLKVFLTRHEESGLFVLCGSDTPDQGEAVAPEHARRIVELLAADFAYVIVDTPAGLDDRTLTVLEQATDVLCVTSTDVSSIRSMGKELRVLDQLGLLSGQRHFVLNRADARVGIEIADVEAALAMSVDAAVPSSRAVPLCMNQGRPVVLDQPSSPVARELTKLAQRIEGRDDAGRRSRLLRRRK